MLSVMPYQRKREIAKRGFNSLFDDFFNDDFLQGFFEEGSTFKTDVVKTDNGYRVEAELPGMKKEDIKLKVEDNVLTIEAERKEESKEEKDNYLRREMRYGKYQRSFRVEDVETKKIEATYQNGILKVELPLLEEKERKTRSIEIK